MKVNEPPVTKVARELWRDHARVQKEKKATIMGYTTSFHALGRARRLLNESRGKEDERPRATSEKRPGSRGVARQYASCLPTPETFVEVVSRSINNRPIRTHIRKSSIGRLFPRGAAGVLF